MNNKSKIKITIFNNKIKNLIKKILIQSKFKIKIKIKFYLFNFN